MDAWTRAKLEELRDGYQWARRWRWFMFGYAVGGVVAIIVMSK